MDVRIDCICPPKEEGPRHPDGDTVTLKDKLTFHEATTITKSVTFLDSDDEDSRAAEILATLSEFYIIVGVSAWTLRDEKNKPVPVNRPTVRAMLLERLDDNTAAVVEAAEILYREVILLPLLRRGSRSSQPTPTSEPTSAKQDGEPPKRRRPSKRSSISTIPTVGTETTSSSLDGDSNFSQSSTTAA